MNRFALTVAMLAVVGMFGTVALSGDDKKGSAVGAGGAPSEAEMHAMMEAMGKTGPQHAMLKEQFAGNWNADVSAFWGPSPEKSTGTVKSEMMLGGRFVHGMFDGTAMGQPFQGMSLTGYDNMKKKYFNTWVDSMGTGLMTSEGDYDSSSKTYTYTGEMMGPDGKMCTVRQLVKVDSNDKHTFTMFAPGPDGKEAKMMEIVYTRKK